MRENVQWVYPRDPRFTSWFAYPAAEHSLHKNRVMTSLVHDLLTAYWVFLPWLILAVGMVVMLVGSTTGRSPNRVLMIGLAMTGAALLWFIARLAA
jgi:hypothetical protein